MKTICVGWGATLLVGCLSFVRAEAEDRPVVVSFCPMARQDSCLVFLASGPNDYGGTKLATIYPDSCVLQTGEVLAVVGDPDSLDAGHALLTNLGSCSDGWQAIAGIVDSNPPPLACSSLYVFYFYSWPDYFGPVRVVEPCGMTPVIPKSWGRLKALYQ